jgi:hypothetical protein
LIPNVEEKKHIVLFCDEDSFAVASVLYSYFLSRHKKVSMVGDVTKRFAFLPWYDALRSTKPASADICIDTRNMEVHKLFLFLKEGELRINKKMATALYCAYFLRYDHFTSADCDGMMFAAISEIISLGAAYKTVQKALLYTEPLKLFRLRAYLYANLQLTKNATKALVYCSDDILDKSGATLDDACAILGEFLAIAHVKEVCLLKSDANNVIVKKIKDKKIEK